MRNLTSVIRQKNEGKEVAAVNQDINEAHRALLRDFEQQ